MGFKPDLDDQLVSFSALTLLVWSVKIVSEMTYYVSSGTLNPTHTLTDTTVYPSGCRKRCTCSVLKIECLNL